MRRPAVDHQHRAAGGMMTAQRMIATRECDQFAGQRAQGLFLGG